MLNNKKGMLALVIMTFIAPVINYHMVDKAWVNVVWRFTILIAFLIGFYWRRKRRLEENMVDPTKYNKLAD